ncbi:MAG: hypothetical protein KIS66_07450 [Fimbriimonadaceae bacterium]|nr:hypothetical protein [Fimbriimonadaceae bacterium]
MPTYVYECKTCDRTFEVEQRITESALTDCDCGAAGQLRRVIQPVAVQFVGSGFHINDYRPSSGSSESAKSKPDAPGCDAPGCACKPSE